MRCSIANIASECAYEPAPVIGRVGRRAMWVPRPPAHVGHVVLREQAVVRAEDHENVPSERLSSLPFGHSRREASALEGAAVDERVELRLGVSRRPAITRTAATAAIRSGRSTEVSTKKTTYLA
jgi:hypothetical protein